MEAPQRSFKSSRRRKCNAPTVDLRLFTPRSTHERTVVNRGLNDSRYQTGKRLLRPLGSGGGRETTREAVDGSTDLVAVPVRLLRRIPVLPLLPLEYVSSHRRTLGGEVTRIENQAESPNTMAPLVPEKVSLPPLHA